MSVETTLGLLKVKKRTYQNILWIWILFLEKVKIAM